MKNYSLMLITFFFSFTFLKAFNSLAQENEEPTTPPAIQIESEEEPIDHHPNYFGISGFMGTGVGLIVYYSHKLSGRWLIGAAQSISLGGYRVKDVEGGDLDSAQYYRENVELQTYLTEVNASFYFRNNGVKRWGAFLRGGVGYANMKAKAHWGRYDRDPAFIIIGDGKRLRESGENTADWSTAYARAGVFYQFLWKTKKDHAVVGHILETGLSTFMRMRDASVTYTKSNGEIVTENADPTSFVFEVGYKFVF